MSIYRPFSAAWQLTNGEHGETPGTASTTDRVRGGFYVASNGDPRSVTGEAPLRAITQYHALHEPGTSQFPGWQDTWRMPLYRQGVDLTLVTELKSFAAGSAQVGAQSFAVEGRNYTVPAMEGRVQLGSNTSTTGPWAYSYEQVYTGKIDGLLHRLLAALRAKPVEHEIIVQFASERDTDNQFGTMKLDTAGGPAIRRSWAESDTLALSAYTYAIRWLRDPPAGIPPLAPGVKFTLGWAGHDWSGQAAFLRSHPASLAEYIDYVHWNVYHHNTSRASTDPATAARARLEETLAFYRAAPLAIRRKPITVSEWGAHPTIAPGQADYIAAMPAAINAVNRDQHQRGEGQYAGQFNYFHSNGNWGVFDPPAAGRAAITTAYQTGPFTRPRGRA